MARGRKKDPTIMAGRALTLQRDYRARKAQYVADLEARCAAAEAENVRLREEVVFLRGQSGSPATLSPAVIQASAQLRDTLAAASSSLAYFMQVALPAESRLETMPVLAPVSDSESPAETVPPHHLNDNTAVSGFDRPVRPESPCCGGYIICEGLVEEEAGDEVDGYWEKNGAEIFNAISQIRSTSSAR
ncbi:hypothetical protein B0H14DRAFT_150071 [Mycena olivaceomarginata]|nr:hypothetical protein B0H14DRAFT_150071 [Mycena olivaceomarginata]